MVDALGVNQALLFTSVFAVGSALAGLGGALQVAREPANLAADWCSDRRRLSVQLSSVAWARSPALCARRRDHQAKVKQSASASAWWISGLSPSTSAKLTWSQILVMAVVLIVRPCACSAAGRVLFEIAEAEGPDAVPATPALKMSVPLSLLLFCLPLLAQSSPYLLILGIDVLIAVIFATSLHFIMGPGGMHSFGHAAYFGLGAYGAALLVKWVAVPMGLALVRPPRRSSRLRGRCCLAGSRCGSPGISRC